MNIPSDYLEHLKNLQDTVTRVLANKGEAVGKCKPCEEGALALPKDKIERLLVEARGWQLIEDKKIVKEFKFKDFLEAKFFLDLVAAVAEKQGHHPTITIIYNKVKIILTTHAVAGLTENDFIMSRFVDVLGVIG